MSPDDDTVYIDSYWGFSNYVSQRMKCNLNYLITYSEFVNCETTLYMTYNKVNETYLSDICSILWKVFYRFSQVKEEQ